MTNLTLNDDFVKDILEYLGCEKKSPSLRYLNQLISAYTRRVPWESVSRLLKRHMNASTAGYPRWVHEFWRDAFRYGTGGTCFESSLAFYSFLTSLGYQGYLTVNDMGTSKACHAAIIVLLKGNKYLVDITIPVHSAVQVIPGKTTHRRTFFHTYTIRPAGDFHYHVDRSAHPNRNAFTLVDIPVSEQDYRDIVTRDYEESGHFLKSVVMVKVIDDKVWRFNSAEKPFKLTGFNRAGKTIIVLSPRTLAHTLARKFLMPEEQIAAALSIVGDSPATAAPQLAMTTPAAEMSLARGGQYVS